jgi:acetyl-CoA acyltransferase
MANDVWILGIHMTKFGRHGDKDALDLACEAALGALEDAGVGSADMQVMACGTRPRAWASRSSSRSARPGFPSTT